MEKTEEREGIGIGGQSSHSVRLAQAGPHGGWSVLRESQFHPPLFPVGVLKQTLCCLPGMLCLDGQNHSIYREAWHKQSLLLVSEEVTVRTNHQPQGEQHREGFEVGTRKQGSICQNLFLDVLTRLLALPLLPWAMEIFPFQKGFWLSLNGPAAARWDLGFIWSIQGHLHILQGHFSPLDTCCVIERGPFQGCHSELQNWHSSPKKEWKLAICKSKQGDLWGEVQWASPGSI